MPKINGFEILEIHLFDFENGNRQVKEKQKQSKIKSNKEQKKKNLNIFWFVIEIIEAISKNFIKNEIVQLNLKRN